MHQHVKIFIQANIRLKKKKRHRCSFAFMILHKHLPGNWSKLGAEGVWAEITRLPLTITGF